MNGYRAPVGHQPYMPERRTDHIGRLSGLCAMVLLCGMITLSLLALDHHAADQVGGQHTIAMEATR